jgi:hypothetical protein
MSILIDRKSVRQSFCREKDQQMRDDKRLGSAYTSWRGGSGQLDALAGKKLAHKNRRMEAISKGSYPVATSRLSP